MEHNEKNTYDKNLSEYSSIIKGKIKDREEIENCLKVFEYFEDYEKCKDLKKLLKDLDKQVDDITNY